MNLARRDPLIARLEEAKAALVKATSPHQVKKIIDLAAAGEVYARRQQLGEETIGYAHAIKTEALVRLGPLLRDQPKAKGGQPYQKGQSTHSRAEQVETLSQLLKTDTASARKTAMIAKQLADLPEPIWRAIAARKMTLTEARRQARHAERPTRALPEGIYRVLYADPPWQYRDTRLGLGADTQGVDRAETAAAQDYPTMDVATLCDLKVSQLVPSDAVLFCWATFPLLPDALRVVEAWSFTYKTAFVWKKPRGSFGHYHKADAELLLLATRGSCTPDAQTRHSQILEAETSGHSRKPEAARAMIDQLYPHGPRIELFARLPASAPWQAWGNEP